MAISITIQFYLCKAHYVPDGYVGFTSWIQGKDHSIFWSNGIQNVIVVLVFTSDGRPRVLAF